jgi:hypothetical protein
VFKNNKDSRPAAKQGFLTLTLIYILVVGQFGLATGSGGITQSNVHTTSRVHQKNNDSRPAAKVMVHSNPAGTIPLQLCTMIMTNPQTGCQLPGILLQKV